MTPSCSSSFQHSLSFNLEDDVFTGWTAGSGHPRVLQVVLELEGDVEVVLDRALVVAGRNRVPSPAAGKTALRTVIGLAEARRPPPHRPEF